MISSDSQTVIIFNYIVLGIVGILTVIGLLSFIIWLCVSVK
jgi:nitrate reductase NapE component